ncbi:MULTISPECIES: cobalamin biosynthesis protein [unclassified Sphingomonas]|uniref:cobalamin biosynthesis protein n=1 Tax=unclassified Sphingomonas TaxID=196159 RepID=UPI00226AD616
MERHPVIVAGFGCRSVAGLPALRDALASAQRGQPAVTALAAPDDKLAQVAPLAAAMSLPLIAVPAAALRSQYTTTQSPASLHARGTGSVAEAAALAGAGAGGRLLASRHVSPDRTATCAIAQGMPA